MGCRREKRLCQRARERTQVGVLTLTTGIPFSTATSSDIEKGEETDSLLIKRATEPVRDKNKGYNLQSVPGQETGRGLRSVINLRGLGANSLTFTDL